MTRIDAEYYRTREQQERESAGRAEDDIARRVHLEMAARYAELQSEMAAAKPVDVLKDIASAPTQIASAQVAAR